MTVGGFVSQTVAQQGLPNYVAVVDLAQLIKDHPEFRGKQEALQQEVRAEEVKFQTRQKQIVDRDKALQQNSAVKPGTAEHQREVDAIASEYADFEKDVKAMQRKFALKNARIMYDTYQDIKKVIGAFAKTRRIAQITDYRYFDVNPADPQSVAEDMDQKLIWFDEQLNITDYVIDALYAAHNMPRPPKQQANAVAGAGQQPVAAASAQPQPAYSSQQQQPQGVPVSVGNQNQPMPRK
jgi:Skp family chaperone for outer membrane proteins